MNTNRPADKSRRTRLIWLGASAAVFILCVTALLFSVAPKEGTFAWLNPASFTRPGAVGPLTRFRRRVQSLPGISSLVTRYRRTQPSILVDTDVWKIAPAAGAQATLGPPLATNADGMRVWVLPAAAMTNFDAHLKGIAGADRMMSPRMMVLNGSQGQIQAGNWVRTGKNLFGGLTIDVVGKVFYSSVKMSVGVTATKVVAAPNGTQMLKTNLAAGCQVVLPNGGALVIDSGKANDEDGKIYWMVVSPSAVDARGNPIGK